MMPVALQDAMIFAMASLALNLTPGNDMMFVLGQSLRNGAKAGLAAGFGISAGSAIHILLVAFGVAIILARHPMIFEAIRWAGAAYLIWMAWTALTAPAEASAGRAGDAGTAWKAFRDGGLVNLLNPKIIVFMFAFLPPFIRPENGQPLVQLAVFGAIFIAGGTAVNAAVAASSGGIGRLLSGSARAARVLKGVSALCFVALAAKLVLEKR